MDVSSDSSHDLKKSTYYMLDDSDYKEKDVGNGNSDAPSEASDSGHGHGHEVLLARIPTCAVFHKLTHGRGVPHSFVSEYDYLG